MQPVLPRAWRPTHRIRTLDSAHQEVLVMLCPNAEGDGPAYAREEWVEAVRFDMPPPPVWTRQDGQWLALGSAPRLLEGQPLFWAEPLDPEEGA